MSNLDALFTSRRRLLAAGLGGGALLVLPAVAACSTSSTPGGEESFDPEAPVTISVGGKPTADQAASLKTFNDQLAQFTTAHPNITVNAEETKWDAQTFNAMVAAGTLPTTMTVPFTDIQALIEREQVLDITSLVAADSVLSKVNPDVAKIAQRDGKTYGVASSAYTMGLIYNRALYTAAGLDPDKPPATWDEVVSNAAAITQKTGKPGFTIPTTNNVGGWYLTTMSYSNGSLMETRDGEKFTATINTDGAKASLEILRQIRWDKNAFGSNFLLDLTEARSKIFPSGAYGQAVDGADVYGGLVTNGMKGDDVGIGPLPQGTGGLGTLGGGAVQIISPKASRAEAFAALEWVKFRTLQKYFDQELAISNAKAAAEDGRAVGVPEVPVLEESLYSSYLEWIKPYLNVPREHFEVYLASLSTLPIVPEPAKKGQELYASLDPVVQAVLTRQDANIEELLAKAETDVQAQIDAS